MPGPGTVHTTVAGYTGPGDVQSGALFWIGARGYSAAVAATGTQKALGLRRNSDNVTCDFLVAVTGGMGLSTATCNGSTQGGITPTSFAGTDVSGTGAITGTTLTLTGGHIGDVITGGTTAVGTYIVSGSSPTWTVNISQTVVSATLTATWGLFVATAYDQAGHSGGPFNFTQATSANQPLYVPTGGPSGAKPQIIYNGSQFLTFNFATTASGWTASSVANQTGSFTTPQSIFATDGTLVQQQYSNGGASGTSVIYAGTVSSAVATSVSTWHALQFVFNGSSSDINVDGTSNTVSAGTANTGNNGFLGAGSSSAQQMFGAINEFGAWQGVSFSSGTSSSMSSQQHTYWGF